MSFGKSFSSLGPPKRKRAFTDLPSLEVPPRTVDSIEVQKVCKKEETND